MNIKDVVAVMAVRANPDDEVGKLDITNSDHGGVYLKKVGKTETEFFSEVDFEEPSRENFENLIKELISDDYKPVEGVTLHFLTELKGEK